MTNRIFTTDELDQYLVQNVDVDSPEDLVQNVDVDSPEDFYQNAVLLAVYKDGRFEIVTDTDEEITLNIVDCKVFPSK